MRTTSLICLLLILIPSLANAQRPIRPLLPLRAYTLQDYRPVDFREALALPATAHHGWANYQDTDFSVTGGSG